MRKSHAKTENKQTKASSVSKPSKKQQNISYQTAKNLLSNPAINNNEFLVLQKTKLLPILNSYQPRILKHILIGQKTRNNSKIEPGVNINKNYGSCQLHGIALKSIIGYFLQWKKSIRQKLKSFENLLSKTEINSMKSSKQVIMFKKELTNRLQQTKVINKMIQDKLMKIMEKQGMNYIQKKIQQHKQNPIHKAQPIAKQTIQLKTHQSHQKITQILDDFTNYSQIIQAILKIFQFFTRITRINRHNDTNLNMNRTCVCYQDIQQVILTGNKEKIQQMKCNITNQMWSQMQNKIRQALMICIGKKISHSQDDQLHQGINKTSKQFFIKNKFIQTSNIHSSNKKVQNGKKFDRFSKLDKSITAGNSSFQTQPPIINLNLVEFKIKKMFPYMIQAMMQQLIDEIELKRLLSQSMQFLRNQIESVSNTSKINAIIRQEQSKESSKNFVYMDWQRQQVNFEQKVKSIKTGMQGQDKKIQQMREKQLQQGDNQPTYKQQYSELNFLKTLLKHSLHLYLMRILLILRNKIKRQDNILQFIKSQGKQHRLIKQSVIQLMSLFSTHLLQPISTAQEYQKGQSESLVPQINTVNAGSTGFVASFSLAYSPLLVQILQKQVDLKMLVRQNIRRDFSISKNVVQYFQQVKQVVKQFNQSKNRIQKFLQLMIDKEYTQKILPNVLNYIQRYEKAISSHPNNKINIFNSVVSLSKQQQKQQQKDENNPKSTNYMFKYNDSIMIVKGVCVEFQHYVRNFDGLGLDQKTLVTNRTNYLKRSQLLNFSRFIQLLKFSQIDAVKQVTLLYQPKQFLRLLNTTSMDLLTHPKFVNEITYLINKHKQYQELIAGEELIQYVVRRTQLSVQVMDVLLQGGELSEGKQSALNRLAMLFNGNDAKTEQQTKKQQIPTILINSIPSQCVKFPKLLVLTSLEQISPKAMMNNNWTNNDKTKLIERQQLQGNRQVSHIKYPLQQLIKERQLILSFKAIEQVRGMTFKVNQRVGYNIDDESQLADLEQFNTFIDGNIQWLENIRHGQMIVRLINQMIKLAIRQWDKVIKKNRFVKTIRLDMCSKAILMNQERALQRFQLIEQLMKYFQGLLKLAETLQPIIQLTKNTVETQSPLVLEEIVKNIKNKQFKLLSANMKKFIRINFITICELKLKITLNQGVGLTKQNYDTLSQKEVQVINSGSKIIIMKKSLKSKNTTRKLSKKQSNSLKTYNSISKNASNVLNLDQISQNASQIIVEESPNLHVQIKVSQNEMDVFILDGVPRMINFTAKNKHNRIQLVDNRIDYKSFQIRVQQQQIQYLQHYMLGIQLCQRKLLQQLNKITAKANLFPRQSHLSSQVPYGSKALSNLLKMVQQSTQAQCTPQVMIIQLVEQLNSNINSYVKQLTTIFVRQHVQKQLAGKQKQFFSLNSSGSVNSHSINASEVLPLIEQKMLRIGQQWMQRFISARQQTGTSLKLLSRQNQYCYYSLLQLQWGNRLNSDILHQPSDSHNPVNFTPRFTSISQLIPRLTGTIKKPSTYLVSQAQYSYPDISSLIKNQSLMNLDISLQQQSRQVEMAIKSKDRDKEVERVILKPHQRNIILRELTKCLQLVSYVQKSSQSIGNAYDRKDDGKQRSTLQQQISKPSPPAGNKYYIICICNNSSNETPVIKNQLPSHQNSSTSHFDPNPHISCLYNIMHEPQNKSQSYHRGQVVKQKQSGNYMSIVLQSLLIRTNDRPNQIQSNARISSMEYQSNCNYGNVTQKWLKVVSGNSRYQQTHTQKKQDQSSERLLLGQHLQAQRSDNFAIDIKYLIVDLQNFLNYFVVEQLIIKKGLTLLASPSLCINTTNTDNRPFSFIQLIQQFLQLINTTINKTYNQANCITQNKAKLKLKRLEESLAICIDEVEILRYQFSIYQILEKYLTDSEQQNKDSIQQDKHNKGDQTKSKVDNEHISEPLLLSLKQSTKHTKPSMSNPFKKQPSSSLKEPITKEPKVQCDKKQLLSNQFNAIINRSASKQTNPQQQKMTNMLSTFDKVTSLIRNKLNDRENRLINYQQTQEQLYLKSLNHVIRQHLINEGNMLDEWAGRMDVKDKQFMVKNDVKVITIRRCDKKNKYDTVALLLYLESKQQQSYLGPQQITKELPPVQRFLLQKYFWLQSYHQSKVFQISEEFVKKWQECTGVVQKEIDEGKQMRADKLGQKQAERMKQFNPRISGSLSQVQLIIKKQFIVLRLSHEDQAADLGTSNENRANNKRTPMTSNKPRLQSQPSPSQISKVFTNFSSIIQNRTKLHQLLHSLQRQSQQLLRYIEWKKQLMSNQIQIEQSEVKTKAKGKEQTIIRMHVLQTVLQQCRENYGNVQPQMTNEIQIKKQLVQLDPFRALQSLIVQRDGNSKEHQHNPNSKMASQSIFTGVNLKGEIERITRKDHQKYLQQNKQPLQLVDIRQHQQLVSVIRGDWQQQQHKQEGQIRSLDKWLRFQGIQRMKQRNLQTIDELSQFQRQFSCMSRSSLFQLFIQRVLNFSPLEMTSILQGRQPKLLQRFNSIQPEGQGQTRSKYWWLNLMFSFCIGTHHMNDGKSQPYQLIMQQPILGLEFFQQQLPLVTQLNNRVNGIIHLKRLADETNKPDRKQQDITLIQQVLGLLIQEMQKYVSKQIFIQLPQSKSITQLYRQGTTVSTELIINTKRDQQLTAIWTKNSRNCEVSKESNKNNRILVSNVTSQHPISLMKPFTIHSVPLTIRQQQQNKQSLIRHAFGKFISEQIFSNQYFSELNKAANSFKVQGQKARKLLKQVYQQITQQQRIKVLQWREKRSEQEKIRKQAIHKQQAMKILFNLLLKWAIILQRGRKIVEKMSAKPEKKSRRLQELQGQITLSDMWKVDNVDFYEDLPQTQRHKFVNLEEKRWNKTLNKDQQKQQSQCQISVTMSEMGDLNNRNQMIQKQQSRFITTQSFYNSGNKLKFLDVKDMVKDKKQGKRSEIKKL